MKRTQIVTIVVALAGAAAALWVFGTSTFGLLSAANVAVIITIGGVMVDRMLVKREDRVQGFAVTDERTMLLEGKASRAAFMIGNYVWLALLWYEFAAENWMPWPKIGSPPVILLGLMAQLAVYFAARLMMAKSVKR
ncbi:hypothetical protein JXL21_09280 [Candidatus Bathyarchaeota archaeon]|nr:hypothetical protein [Candidatus Bathyarchaeota archaeon]